MLTSSAVQYSKPFSSRSNLAAAVNCARAARMISMFSICASDIHERLESWDSVIGAVLATEIGEQVPKQCSRGLAGRRNVMRWQNLHGDKAGRTAET